MHPRTKKPATLRSPWPPTDAAGTVNVTPWEDWWNVGRLHGRSDPWDLISYNFDTYVPEEVNWYLHEWLGCELVSLDGLNYRFGRASGDTRPMTIYLPPPGWVAPGPNPEGARKVILDVLSEPGVAAMAFKVGRFELVAGDLTDVAQAIRSGRIRVVHRPSAGHMAYYNSWTNTMIVSWDTLPAFGSRALIVHESVHAVEDLRRMRQTMAESEAFAYVAQALYEQLHGLDLGSAVVAPGPLADPVNWIAWTGIFTRAAAIARQISSGADPSDLDVGLLGASILTAPTYRNEGPPANNGI